MENDTIERKELVWKNITKRIQDALHPLILVTNTAKHLENNQEPLLQVPENILINTCSSTEHYTSSDPLVHAIKAYAQCHSIEKKRIYIGLSP
jgi:hypothetical protein